MIIIMIIIIIMNNNKPFIDIFQTNYFLQVKSGEKKYYSAKLKKLFWSVSWNPHLMKMLVARSYFYW